MRAPALLLTLILFPGLAGAAAALQQGQWVTVRGHLDSTGAFVAQKISFTELDDEAAITATLTVDDRGRLHALSHTLELTSDVARSGIQPHDLPGSRVKVQGELMGPMLFRVEEIKARGPGRDRIEGPVDMIAGTDGRPRAHVLGYALQISASTEFDQDAAAGIPRVSSTAAPRLFASRFSDDGPDEDDRFGSGLRLSDSLRLTSRIVGESAWEDNFNLNQTDNENRKDLGLSVRSRLEWDPNSDLRGVFELRYNARHREREDRRNEDESRLEIGEAFLHRRLGLATDVSLGRQDFDDPREWLYDQNLDAVRLSWNWLGLRMDASASKIFSDDGSREEDADNYIVTATRVLDDGEISAYYIDRDYAEVFDEQTYHYGLRFIGDWLYSDRVWLELSRQQGKRQGAQVDGYAADIGGTWHLGATSPWYATVGLAFASGDDPNTASDETYRQTGLQDNNGRFGGITSFRYYGELSDPELSNLHISTVGIGRRMSQFASIDLVAHSYRLDEKSSVVSDAEWDREPNGTSVDLGRELDMIFGLRLRDQWEVEAVLGYFDPDSAFDDDSSAWFGKLQLKLRY